MTTSTLRILHLEDDPTDAELIREMLETEGVVCQVTRVETEADFIHFLEQGGFDVVLADHTLPSFDGLSALKITQEKCPDVPFIFVSGTLGEEVAIEALKGGAIDFVLKERLSRIVPSVRRALREAKERSERKRAEEALRESLRESEERRRAAEALARVGRALTETLDVGLVAQRIADSLRELFAGDVAVYRQESSGALVAIGTSEIPIAERPFVHPALPAAHGVSGLAIRERLPVVTADFLEDPRVTHTPEMRALLGVNRARAVLAVPLIARDRVLGTVAVRRVQPFDEQAVALAQVFADQAVVALENARLYQEVRAAYEDRDRLAAVVESSEDAILSETLDGTILSWNAGAERLYGYAAAEVIGQPVSRLAPTEQVDEMPRILERLRRGEHIEHYETVRRKKDGSRIEISLTLSSVRNAAGQVVGASSIARDITARKQAEEALRRAQAELAHVTRVATLGELTGSIAHEINQPLGAVVNNASACLRWLAAQNLEEARQSAARVIADGHRASEIIGRIRALAKRAPSRKDWLDIDETLREVLTLAQSEVQGHRVSLQTRWAGALPPVWGDRIQMQQVMLNLLMNAIEALSGVDEGPRELWVTTDTGEAGDVVVTVRDSGPGLDPQSLDRLFEAFYTTKPNGLGMGLAISRSIVESHGGRLWATANTPRGAVFQFTLPSGREGAA